MGTIEYSTDGGTSFSEIDYRDYTIRNGNGRNLLAPEATVEGAKNIQISTDNIVRIKIDGSRRFEGYANSSGTIDLNGQKTINVRGYGYDIMEGKVSLDLSSVSPETVLSNAISGTSFSISTSTATGLTIGSYSVTNKKRKNIFRDMMDRTSYIIKITPDKTIHFQPTEDEGAWQSIDVESDNAAVPNWNADDKDTIRNKVIVHGTDSGQDITETSTDTSYTSKIYSEEYNFNYISSNSEAQSMADELVQASPLAEGKLIVAESDYTPDIYSNLVNYTITLTDSAKNISSKTVVVDKQIIRESRVELQIGEGESFSIQNVSRKQKSDDEKTSAGKQWSDVYDDGSKPEDNSTSNNVYVQDFEPLGSDGDLWFDTGSGEWYSYDGGWTKSADITSDSNQDFLWLNGSIDSTQITDDTIITRMIAADTIVASHINSNEIDASHINTLYLNSAENARFGTNNNDYITFTDAYGSDNITQMRPSTGGTCYIGDDIGKKPFAFIGANDIFAYNHFGVGVELELLEEGTAVFQPNNSDYNIYIQTAPETSLPEPSICPGTDGKGFLGDYDWSNDTGEKWWNIHANTIDCQNFTNHSPPEMKNKPDIKNIKNKKWDSLPDYVKRETDKDGEEVSTDGDGVELGRMCNYLFNICKEQEKVIESYEDRISELEKKAN